MKLFTALVKIHVKFKQCKSGNISVANISLHAQGVINTHDDALVSQSTLSEFCHDLQYFQ